MAEERPIFSKGQLQDVLRTRDAVKDIQNTMKAMVFLHGIGFLQGVFCRAVFHNAM